MLKLLTANLLLIAWLGVFADAENFVIDQRNKTFFYNGAKAEILKVKAGDTVEFRNLDPYFHNVFSLSDAMLFDLGSYPAGQSKSVVFNKPGKVEVECAIHPLMRMTVEVKK
jgi:plastocyanin